MSVFRQSPPQLNNDVHDVGFVVAMTRVYFVFVMKMCVRLEM